MAEQDPTFLEVVSTDAREVRTAYEGKQPGVMDAGDLKVTAGTGLSVDVAAGVGYVQGTNIADQGLYRCRNDETKNSAAFDLGGIPANNSGQPRIDQVIARLLDQTHDSSGLRKWRLEYVAGVGTSTATIDTRDGAISDVALGNNWLRLADVRVNSGASAPTAIRDRRPTARGLFRHIVRNSNAAAGTDYAPAPATMALVDATNLQPRLECSGVPVRLTVETMAKGSDAPRAIDLVPFIDGVALAGRTRRNDLTTAWIALTRSWVWTPVAGSHLIGLGWHATVGGSVTVSAGATYPLELTLEEIMRPNTDNT